MLRWLHRRRERLKRIEAEADTLIQHLGVEASAEARRQEREANDLAMAWYWNAVALAVVRKSLSALASIPQHGWRWTISCVFSKRFVRRHTNHFKSPGK